MRQRGVSVAALMEVLEEGIRDVTDEGRVLFTSAVSDVEAIVAVDERGRRTVLTVRRRSPWRLSPEAGRGAAVVSAGRPTSDQAVGVS